MNKLFDASIQPRDLEAIDAIPVFKQDTVHDGIYKINRQDALLWSIAREFTRCFEYGRQDDYPGYWVDTPENSGVIYLIGYGGMWVGACEFREAMYPRIVTPVQWVLDWVWIHPLMRRRGLLTQAWPSLEDRHGEFLIYGRMSQAMDQFLDKQSVPETRIVRRLK